MIKIKYYVRGESDEGKIPIHIRVTNGRAFDLKARTKETCLLSDWDSETGLMKEKYYSEVKGRMVERRDAQTRVAILNSKNINARLRDLESRIEDSFKENEGISFNTQWLKDIISPPVVEENNIPDDFIAYCDIFIEQKKHSISRSYIIKINTIKSIIAEFLKHYKRRVLKLCDINMQFGVDFESFSLEVMGYSKNYIERNLKFIKTIAYHAEMNGIELNPQIKNIKSRGEKTVFQVLSFDELDQLENTDIDEGSLQDARDWLLISCYTGQRVSDFMRFSTDMITSSINKNGDEMYFLNFVQQKTKNTIHLPIHPKVLDVLKRRKGNFPKGMSEQHYNELIKRVCKDAGIDELCYGGVNNNGRKVFKEYPKYELVTSHIGRRSFASNHYGRIPTPLLMTATGHGTEQMFLKYIGKIDNQKSNALADYFYG
ncbi:integrase [Elizabethkingia anophelis]|nr:integrase [Elizabethkingia anophelis]